MSVYAGCRRVPSIKALKNQINDDKKTQRRASELIMQSISVGRFVVAAAVCGTVVGVVVIVAVLRL